ncbi:MAG: glycosyltransferase [Bacteroidia bacterium]
MIWIVISLTLTMAYCMLILAYWYGYSRMPYFNLLLEPKTKFTVIIPARNEEKNLKHCVESIINQNYPQELIEIIIVDDNSDDNTFAIADDFRIKYKNITILKTNDFKVSGKKHAITIAIQNAKNDYCVLTDADCRCSENWLLSINSFLQKNQTVFIYAPVTFTEYTLFQKIQALEFAGLVGIGGAAINLKNPNMCSASNMVVLKNVFIEVDGYKDNLHLSAGDDELLLQKIFKHYPNQVYFLKSKQAIVTTDANHTVKQLTDQRRRWVSNSTKYENIYITLILIGAYIFNFSIAFNLIYGIFNQSFLICGLVQLILKIIVEGGFLYNVLKLFNKQYLIRYLLLAQPLHIFYVIVIGIWANINAYNWKGRQAN